MQLSRRRNRLRELLELAREDVAVVLEKDPAASGPWEVLLYPHLHALWLHRLAHRHYRKGRLVLARGLALFGRVVSGGIDIHPGAVIGRRFFIDHGCGVVIGETVRIGDDVMLYHQVTLGSVGWWKDARRPRGTARHPTIEDGVIVGANSLVLGAITIGARTKIGAQALVLESVPPDSIVRGNAATVVQREPRPDDGNGAATPARPEHVELPVPPRTRR
jgi:serine O-acetyltransferase